MRLHPKRDSAIDHAANPSDGFSMELELDEAPSSSPSLYQRLGGHDGISKLLHHFYADVRQQRVIGPIFKEHIPDWGAHILKITEFWARATGGPSLYSGQMPLQHLALGLEPEHFATWLDLWDYNCRRHLAAAEADEMSKLAHNIGARLRQIIATHEARKPISTV
jgi:hemoglobin